MPAPEAPVLYTETKKKGDMSTGGGAQVSADNCRLQPCDTIIINFILQHSRQPQFLRNLDRGSLCSSKQSVHTISSFYMQLGTACADGLRPPGSWTVSHMHPTCLRQEQRLEVPVMLQPRILTCQIYMALTYARRGREFQNVCVTMWSTVCPRRCSSQGSKVRMGSLIFAILMVTLSVQKEKLPHSLKTY